MLQRDLARLVGQLEQLSKLSLSDPAAAASRLHASVLDEDGGMAEPSFAPPAPVIRVSPPKAAAAPPSSGLSPTPASSPPSPNSLLPTVSMFVCV